MSRASDRLLELVTDTAPLDVTPVDGLRSVPSPRWLAEQLRSKICPPERAFDGHLPIELQRVSSCYWTPLRVAMKAAKWLDEIGARTVVDIGSGAGKFCIAAALAGSCQYTGFEQRSRLVAAARKLARLFECEDRVRFLQGELGATSVPHCDAYYLYNPFEENLFGFPDRLDEDVELSEARYARDLAAMRSLLESAPVGRFVLTYNGFGAALPAAYRELRTCRDLPNVLQLWRKMDPASIGTAEDAPGD